MALAGLAAAQKRVGLDVRLLSGYQAGTDISPADSLRGLGIQVELVGPCAGPRSRHPALRGTMGRVVREADVVHIHGVWEEPQHVAAVAAREAGKPYVFTPHGMLDPWSLSKGRWRKRLYMLWRLRKDLNSAAGIHYTTSIERDRAQGGLKLKAPAIVEPNGLDLSEFERLPGRGAFRAKHSISGERAVVLFLSRLHPKKGLDLLIPAFSKSGLSEALLVIAGPGDAEYRARVEKMVADRGLGERVLFTGMLEGAARVEAFVDADLFVLPSYQENFGIAVAEALACGTPVVISDQVNIWPEVSSAGVGSVVPLEVGRLAEEMVRWMGNAGMRDLAKSKARGFVWERYDWARIARGWGEHYGRLSGDGVQEL
jgi:glycosyltransferase involved in cell wall biosynthesis